MKFLHLSDLHIGKTVNGFSMLAEQRHVFKQVVGYVETEKPDAVLIAGDVYDRAVPGVEAVRVFDDFLTELAAKDVAVLLISGNHDSPERLNYASRLLTERKLHLCGVFDGKLQAVTLSDEYGEVDFWLLPFIKPSGVRRMFSDTEIENCTDAVTAALDSADVDFSRRNVLLSHQFYTAAGVTPVRSESEINPVGSLDAVDRAVLPQFDYVALGHLHGAQNVGGAVRYAGSPVKYSFSEWKQDKSATLVTLREKGDIEITTLPLTPLHDMREIKGPFETLTGVEMASQGNHEDYLRVILTDEEEIIDPMGKLRSVYPNVMALGFENSRTVTDVSPISLDAEQMETLSTYDLFSEFFLELSGAVMTEAQSGIVRELLGKGEGE
ncbi:MAG: exonuclease SbcCD subunit D [Clostridiales Family XIII bacterium]|jgi:exonuclease SbcD|nr:exonuclease SbcCD subunit D [Clostridiales Family XIII bacterium]